METLCPATPDELGEALKSCAIARKTIYLHGAGSKHLMAGPLPQAATAITTRALNRVLQYEPQDLTISVESGMPWSDLTTLLTASRQMVPLDPPYAENATVGGVVAANTSGPRRRLYGTARDLVIGMSFVTLEGKTVKSGGMVVKNVAGLDMSKLMIGSFGTLAAIASVNFKLNPMPEQTETFVMRFPSAEMVLLKRDLILKSVLQPIALDLLNPDAASRAGLEKAWTLLLQAGGNPRVMDRYRSELQGAESFGEEMESQLWTRVREFTPRWMAEHSKGCVIRYSTAHSGVRTHLHYADPLIVRAGNGIVYRYCAAETRKFEGRAVVEYAAQAQREAGELWPNPGNDFAIMEKVKALFDPDHLLNPRRMYGRF